MQQSRDKAPTQVDTSDDDHRGIPRDAEGNPVFLILPPALRAQYEHKLALYEAAWHEGEPLAGVEAVKLARVYRQVLPQWPEQAIAELASGQRTAKQAKRYTDAGIRLQRYMAARDLKIGLPGHWPPGHTSYTPDGEPVWETCDLSWEEVWERAAELWAGTDLAASPATFRDDYCAVKRDLEAGHSGKYVLVNDKSGRA